MFDYVVKFLTNEEAVIIKNSDFKSLKYESKKKHDESAYDIAKRNYFERRGGYSRPPRPRHLRQLETKLCDGNIIACKWFSETCVTLVFSSGVIAHITVQPSTLDITQIVFDKYCLGKLVGQTVTGVVLSKKCLLFTHAEKIATLIIFGKPSINNASCLISDKEPYLQPLELGGSGRRVDRHVSWLENTASVSVLIWGSSVAEPAPWSPIIEDHANLHLYQICGQQVNLLAYHQLENEVILAELSQKHENVVHILEQIACHKNGVNLIWLKYEVPQGSSRASKLSSLPESVNRIQIAAQTRVARLSPCDSRLVAACIDGSIHVIHHLAGITHSTRAGFIATDVRWAGDILVAAEESGRLQCFDRALSLIHQHTKCLDLTSYLRDSRRIQIRGTHRTKIGPIILATFSGGPLTLLRIKHPRLLTAWIRSGRMSNAVALLRALDWELEGTECVRGIDEVMRSALRRGSEGVAQAALGTYLAPAAPLPVSARVHATLVNDMARRFFHHLLRTGRVGVALSLGVELAAWDLFVDARWAASRRRLPQLAKEADYYARLYATDSECSESCSQCSSPSCSGSENESSTSSKAIKTNPPPLPRVHVPSQPSILTVPITPNEPHSTNSIRPNLHQYLERDNTIWGTNIKDDSFLNKLYAQTPFKPIHMQNLKWSSMDNVLSLTKEARNEGFVTAAHSKLDLDQQTERIAHKQYKYLLQTELKEEFNHDRYSTVTSNPNFNGRYRQDGSSWPVRPDREKNKVKFSETVTISVVPESGAGRGPDVAQELADSLPLCAPHRYLAAFAPAPPALPPHAHPPAENPPPRPPKIKVVHFGMV